MAIVTKTIGTNARDYSTITAWEADLDEGTIYSAGDDAEGVCYDDSAFDETVSINGGGTIGLSSITLTVDANERHDGTAGTGARIVLSGAPTSSIILMSVPNIHFTLQWLEVDINQQTFNNRKAIEYNQASNVDVLIGNMLVHGADGNSGGQVAVRLVGNTTARHNLTNSMIYDFDNPWSGFSGTSRIIDLDFSNAGCLNVTVHNCQNSNASASGNIYGIRTLDSASSQKVQNCIVTDVIAAGSGTGRDYELTSPATATYDHNLSSDTSASGTGSLTSKAAADQFVSTVVGSEDLHLKTGADAIDAGIDLGTTPSGVEIDIDGRDRDAEGDIWDMGAHELVGAPPAPGGKYRPLLVHGVG